MLSFVTSAASGNTMVTYRILSGGRGVEFKVLDRLTLTELIGVHSDVHSSRDFATQPLLYVWFEFGDEVSRVDISAAELFSAAEALLEATRPQVIKRLTAIYAKNDVPYARSQEWQRYIARIVEVEVFMDRSVALDWLRKRVAEMHGFQIEL
jgi:hypothetical protein